MLMSPEQSVGQNHKRNMDYKFLENNKLKYLGTTTREKFNANKFNVVYFLCNYITFTCNQLYYIYL
jgi:hypothetical protein